VHVAYVRQEHAHDADVALVIVVDVASDGMDDNCAADSVPI
jgi:hypothetical protein